MPLDPDTQLRTRKQRKMATLRQKLRANQAASSRYRNLVIVGWLVMIGAIILVIATSN